MSQTNLKYDKNTTLNYTKQSTSSFDYNMFQGKFSNDAKCRIEKGLVGERNGNSVIRSDNGIIDSNKNTFSHGKLIDLESNLRGQDRRASSCPKSQYKPTTSTLKCAQGGTCVPHPNASHEKNCKFIKYKKTSTQLFENKPFH
jgi:hypothetical protein